MDEIDEKEEKQDDKEIEHVGEDRCPMCGNSHEECVCFPADDEEEGF